MGIFHLSSFIVSLGGISFYLCILFPTTLIALHNSSCAQPTVQKYPWLVLIRLTKQTLAYLKSKLAWFIL